MTKMKLLVVTVTYKSDINEFTQFINSFEKYNDIGEDAKMVVVDNSPIAYRSIENCIKHEFPHIFYIENSSNPGFGASNNIGFEKFDSEFVLFINNDVEFTEPVFKKILSTFNKDEAIGCVGIQQFGGAPSFFRKFTINQKVDDSIFNDEFHHISGAFMFFKSSVFREIGEFDNHLFMYLEEFDLSTRLRAHNYKTSYLPNLSFWHKVGNRNKTSFNEKLWKIGADSHFYICKKYGLPPTIGFYRVNLMLVKFILYFFVKLKFHEAHSALNVLIYRINKLKNING